MCPVVGCMLGVLVLLVKFELCIVVGVCDDVHVCEVGVMVGAPVATLFGCVLGVVVGDTDGLLGVELGGCYQLLPHKNIMKHVSMINKVNR